ncbi:hypothetical protein GRI69_04370 [Erythrobacter vulgaris]|uniref:Glycosyltransferase n=1 Tax=Qipengyuania vulgaris TaxID=291985 RepID=A0A844XPG2_9SPHN|nr:glycosyltransferase family 4 protein [Qipengyuania vulgaris]MXO47490.1 hypothetical protein [Qipengyuania vulgaris]
MNDIIIIIRDYNENLAKRQPWYTIKFLIMALKIRGYRVSVAPSIREVPMGFSGIVVKTLSLSDLLWSGGAENQSFRLYYLATFPLYRIRDFWRAGFAAVFRNFGDLWRLLIGATVPRFWVERHLQKSQGVIFLSDVRYRQYRGDNGYLMIPFIKGNWGQASLEMSGRKYVKYVYVGPPFETRGIDLVARFALESGTKNLRLLVRQERPELKDRFRPYAKAFRRAEVVEGMLSRNELFTQLAQCEMALLPFRLVMAECPIVVLEAIELGLQVITTEECGFASFPFFPGSVVLPGSTLRHAVEKFKVTYGADRADADSFFGAIEASNSDFFDSVFPVLPAEPPRG